MAITRQTVADKIAAYLPASWLRQAAAAQQPASAQLGLQLVQSEG